MGTTGRFPWEKLPCSSPRWPCASLHRVQASRRRGAGARGQLRSSLYKTQPRKPCGQLDHECERSQLQMHALLQIGCIKYQDLDMVAGDARSKNISLQVIMVETFLLVLKKRN